MQLIGRENPFTNELLSDAGTHVVEYVCTNQINEAKQRKEERRRVCVWALLWL